nr:MAG TPA: hypothetical protein [Caudoviricetes sp.]
MINISGKPMNAKKPRDLTISRLFACRAGSAPPRSFGLSVVPTAIYVPRFRTRNFSMPGCSKQTVCDGRVGYG